MTAGKSPDGYPCLSKDRRQYLRRLMKDNFGVLRDVCGEALVLSDELEETRIKLYKCEAILHELRGFYLPTWHAFCDCYETKDMKEMERKIDKLLEGIK